MTQDGGPNNVKRIQRAITSEEKSLVRFAALYSTLQR